MAEPARKLDDIDDEVAPSPKSRKGNFRSIPGGGQKSNSDYAPSILRLVKQKDDQEAGPQTEDRYQSQTEDTRQRLASRDPDRGYQSQTAPAGFRAPQPERNPSEQKAFNLGRNLGQIRQDPKQGTARALQDYLNPGQGGQQPAPGGATAAAGLNPQKLGNLAAKGDPRGAVGEIATQIGVGKKFGHILFAVWGILFFLSGAIPIVGLFNASITFIIFNLLLFSPKTVYQITELILDLVGVGEVLQGLDKVGLSKTKITIAGWEKIAIIVMDVGFFIWHLIFVFMFTYYLCSLAGIGSGIPGVNTVLNVVAKAGDAVTGLPISGLREVCQSFGANLGEFGGPNPDSIPRGFTSSGCEINQGYCKPETLAEKGQQYGCVYKGESWDPILMSRICSHESNGVSKMSGTDRCNQMVTYPDGHTGYLSWSGGLFQIDIFTATSKDFAECVGLVGPTDTSPDGTGSRYVQSHGSCVGGVNGGHWKGNYCDLRNCGLKPGVSVQQYQACVNALFNIEENYQVACTKFSGIGYNAWPDSAEKCGAL